MPTRGGRPRLPPALRGPGPLPGLCAGPQGSFVPRRPRNLPARAGSPRGRPLGPPPPPPPPVAVGPPLPPCSPRRSAAAACLLRHLRGHLPWVVGCLAAAFLILICVCVCLSFSSSFGGLGFYPQGRDSRPHRAPRCPFIRDFSSPTRRLSRLSPCLLLDPKPHPAPSGRNAAAAPAPAGRAGAIKGSLGPG